MIIDAHHHFWRYDPTEYDWIGPPMARIRRDFLPEDLRPTIGAAGVDAVITVQARQTIQETRWLLQLAAECDWMWGVVGWVPLIADDARAAIDEFSAFRKLRGVRHVLQAEADEYMLRDDFNRGVSQLREFDLRYDLLVFEQQLPAAIQFADRHPDQVFVLDHIAKPKIRAGELSPWRENIRQLAERQNVYCKLSGIVTEADWKTWTIDDLRPYFEVVLEAFGPHRLMFGSDWPVCLVACEYRQWLGIVDALTDVLSRHERDRIFSGTAIEAYGLRSS